MKRAFFISFLLLSFLAHVQGQKLYRTLDGKIEIRGKGKEGALTARSNELFVRVDHKNGEVLMRLDQSSLSTGIDSIDRKLDSLPDAPIFFKGRLKRGGFDPNHCYSSTPLRIEGVLKYKDFRRDVIGKGEFKSRFSNDRIPCLLEIGMEIDLGKVQVKGLLPGFKENVRIHILQALLNPKH